MDAHKTQEKKGRGQGEKGWIYNMMLNQRTHFEPQKLSCITSNSHAEIGSLHSQEVLQEVLLLECSCLEKKQGSLQL